MTNVAIIQPYLFPYIGYFQLIDKCNIFVLYDDTSYIKRGFINRNFVSDGTQVIRFTVPVPGSSQNIAIKDLRFDFDACKLLKTLENCYKNASYYSSGMRVVEKVIEYAKDESSIARVVHYSLKTISDLIGLSVRYMYSSEIEYDRALSRSRKLIHMSKLTQSSNYVNPIGGASLYSKEFFRDRGMQLLFLEPQIVPYQQFSGEFSQCLSILDFLMHLPPDSILRHCQMGKLV